MWLPGLEVKSTDVRENDSSEHAVLTRGRGGPCQSLEC